MIMSTTINVQLSHIPGSRQRYCTQLISIIRCHTYIHISCHTVSQLHHVAYSSEVIQSIIKLGGNVFYHDTELLQRLYDVRFFSLCLSTINE